ncbi:MAG: hypothetical protein M0C28_07285 [Candidatus Moduliflexus flocculans]|nr:hypothetical protein [Candidatus Moduliflexus flocculans]
MTDRPDGQAEVPGHVLDGQHHRALRAGRLLLHGLVHGHLPEGVPGHEPELRHLPQRLAPLGHRSTSCPSCRGTLADKFGFKRSLSVSFVLISIGYLVMGNLQRLWPGLIGGARPRPSTSPSRSCWASSSSASAARSSSPASPAPSRRRPGRGRRWPSASSTWSSTSARSPAASVSYFVRTSLGIPAIFTYAATRLRPGRAAGHRCSSTASRSTSATARRTARPVQKRTLGQALAWASSSS